MAQPDDVLRFWFDRQPNEPATGESRKVWFSKNPAFDQEIRDRFYDVYNQAAAGELNAWKLTAPGTLALILVLDQFSRNMFRAQPQAFATDAQALEAAQNAIAQGFDQILPPIQRWFLYMPFMHSEDLEHQHQSVELFRSLSNYPDVASGYPYAIRHREVIERFGRFPHRNQILGRPTTPAEAEFLKQPGSSF